MAGGENHPIHTMGQGGPTVPTAGFRSVTLFSRLCIHCRWQYRCTSADTGGDRSVEGIEVVCRGRCTAAKARAGGALDTQPLVGSWLEAADP